MTRDAVFFKGCGGLFARVGMGQGRVAPRHVVLADLNDGLALVAAGSTASHEGLWRVFEPSVLSSFTADGAICTLGANFLEEIGEVVFQMV